MRSSVRTRYRSNQAAARRALKLSFDLHDGAKKQMGYQHDPVPRRSLLTAILRTNSQTRVLEEALADPFVQPCRCGQFCDRAEVKDTMSWMCSGEHSSQLLSSEPPIPKRGTATSITAIREIADANNVNLHVAAQQFAANGGRGANLLRVHA